MSPPHFPLHEIGFSKKTLHRWSFSSNRLLEYLQLDCSKYFLGNKTHQGKNKSLFQKSSLFWISQWVNSHCLGTFYHSLQATDPKYLFINLVYIPSENNLLVLIASLCLLYFLKKRLWIKKEILSFYRFFLIYSDNYGSSTLANKWLFYSLSIFPFFCKVMSMISFFSGKG